MKEGSSLGLADPERQGFTIGVELVEEETGDNALNTVSVWGDTPWC